MHAIAAKATCFAIAATERVPRLPAAGARERRRARRRAAGGRRSTCSPAAPTRTSSSSTSAAPSGRARTRRSGWTRCKLTVNRNTVPFDERPPTVASGVRARHAGGDDARLRRGRLPRGRPDHRATRSATTPTSARSRARSVGALRDAARSTRASAATRPTVTRRRDGVEARSRSRTRSCSTSSACCATSTTTTADFRQLVNELTLLLTYEATKDLADRGGRDRDAARAHDGAAHLRARRSPSARSSARASGCSTASSRSIPGARVGFIGLYRNEETLQPVEYYVKLPDRHRRARRDPARPDARDRQLDRRRRRRVKKRRRDARSALIALDRRARGHRARPRRDHPGRARSSSPRSTAA